MNREQFEKIMADCTAYDDICLTFGGFGEPLTHPDLPAMTAAAKSAGIYGINIETDGLLLQGDLAEALLASPADIISVYLDADSSELYRAVKGRDAFTQAARNVEQFARHSTDSGGPLVVPHLVKTRETMPEMEAFYDRWIQCCGAAVIVGFNDFAGQIPDKAVMDMSPPRRFACARLWRTMTILADGKMTPCGQDFKGEHTIGNVLEQSVGELWRSEQMETLRQAHRQDNYQTHPLCAACKEWHR